MKKITTLVRKLRKECGMWLKIEVAVPDEGEDEKGVWK